jgi:DNA-binding beta-propeller fold protein YncE
MRSETMKAPITALLVVLILIASAAIAGERVSPPPAKFASKPTVSKQGSGAKISFEVSAKTDVEVAILDANGKVVRHLVAGVLGEKPPAPLKPGLKQELLWDGKDDAGKPVSGAKVRVSLGMKPRLEKVIGDNPSQLGGVRGLAVGPEGELFVFHVYGAIHPGDGTGFCTVFSREGKYLRTIMPWPANTPAEKMKGLKRITLDDGRIVPYLFQAETRSMIQGVGELPVQRPVVHPDGRLAFVGHEEWCKSKLRYNRPGPNRITVIRTDGSIPEPPLRSELDDFSAAGGGVMALSPDGKTIYVTRVLSGYKGWHHAVYKCGWAKGKKTVFAGKPKTAGAGEKLFKKPWSISVDAAGNVYVSDRGNNRLVVLDSAGKYLGKLKIENPDQVCVHPKTGTIYMTAGLKDRKLLKFKDWKTETPLFEMKLPFYSRDSVTMLALDKGADKPVLWYGCPRSYYAGKFSVLRIEDLGEKFSDAQRLMKIRDRKNICAGNLIGLALQRGTGKLLVNSRAYDTKTGTWGRGLRANHGGKSGAGSFGLDDRFYSLRYARNLMRFGKDLKSKPFGEQKELIGPKGGTTHVRGRGVTADAAGNIYCIWQDKDASHHVTLYDSTGKVASERIIDSKIRGIQSVRVDAAGNIYLAVCVRPEGVKAPAELDRLRLGTSWHSKMLTSKINWYELLYGCIVKFPAKGGAIKAGEGVPMEYGIQDKRKRHTKIKGADWIYFGASPVVTWRQSFPDSCVCEGSTFDVDAFGRSIFPDAGRTRCGVLDAAGNEICFFGDYGNADSAGKGSKIPKPAIPMLWPYMIEAGEGVVYVGDRLNRRVLQIRLEHTVTEDCEIK